MKGFFMFRESFLIILLLEVILKDRIGLKYTSGLSDD